jgi:hypothetical protein
MKAILENPCQMNLSSGPLFLVELFPLDLLGLSFLWLSYITIQVCVFSKLFVKLVS